MDIAKLHEDLTRDSGIGSIRATWVERFVESPISFWCDIHAPEGMQDSIDPFVQHLFQAGQEHQTSVTDQSYPEAVQEIFFTEEDGFRRTLELMSEGEKFIKNMPLLSRPIGLEGRPDLLVRVDDIESELGSFIYELVEFKSARRIRDAHILQGAFYNRLLGIVQGYEPVEFYIINRDAQDQIIKMSDFTEKLDAALEAMRRIIAGEMVEPAYRSAKWPWESYVNKLAVEANDVSLLPGVGGAKREVLASAGFGSVDTISEADEKSLIRLPGIGGPTAKKFISSAQSIQQGVPIQRGTISAIRHGETEVFLDLEGTDPRVGGEGLEVVNYLIGTLIRKASEQSTFVPFFAPTFDGEEQILQEFFEWGNTLDDPVFYHWHHYERTHLIKMTQHYGLPEAITSRVMERLVDLSPITTKSFAFPAYGEGLKDIAKTLGFTWRQEDVDALISVTLYLQYVESGGADEEARNRILTYNEDDCLATMHVFDWLLSQQE